MGTSHWLGGHPIARHAVLLTGGLAVGKSAVAKEVVALASERDLAVAAVDLDWLGWASGGSLSVDELINRNLAIVAATYLAAGIERLVLARAIASSSNLAAIGQALAGWKLTVIRVSAPRPTVERRIRARDSGAELEEHLGQIAEMTMRTDAVAPEAPVVVNDDGLLREAALEVIRLAGWNRD